MLCSVLGFKPHLPQQNTLSPIISPIMHAHAGSNNMEASIPHCTEYLYSQYCSLDPKVSCNRSKLKTPSEFILYTKDKTVPIFPPPFNFLLLLVCADKLLTKSRDDLKISVFACWIPVKMWFECTQHFLDFSSTESLQISSDLTISIRKVKFNVFRIRYA